jgi:hypothetical protein
MMRRMPGVDLRHTQTADVQASTLDASFDDSVSAPGRRPQAGY